ncbi:hypothetical protein [Streptomyces canus]|uniref:hypothetical protein n=1 Tax=Streptomyces canus TaxID=58343 RepID=UPI002E33B390|nr:hypothetical protein [Streptomyces canus]
MAAVPWQFLPEESTAPHVERLDREVLLLRGSVVVAGGADALAGFVGSSPSRTIRTVAAVLGLPGVRTCARAVHPLGVPQRSPHARKHGCVCRIAALQLKDPARPRRKAPSCAVPGPAS